MTEPIWNILIATTLDRRPMFRTLMNRFEILCAKFPVKVLFEEDNKQISIGAKRQKLLNRATADYISFFDSDDWPYDNYVTEQLKALEQWPDCVGMLIHMTTNAKNPQTCCHSLRYPVWKENVDGYDFVRNVTHFNCVQRGLALQVGFRDLRFGEDHIYADALTKLCKTEVFIDKKLFHYRYTNTVSHKQKYGIR